MTTHNRPDRRPQSPGGPCTIDIRYVPFSEHPREIGPIDFWWVFGELREVADVDVDRYR